MRRLIYSLIIFALFGTSCSSARKRGYSVEGLIRRAKALHVDDQHGFRFAKYVVSDLPKHLQRACMLWPLQRKNQVSSRYGRRWGRKHGGLDLRTPVGTPIQAVLPGKIVYSGDQVRGFGNLLIIKHARNLHTVYAHNNKNMALVGTQVKQGEVIALSGKTGRVTGPHLHFEVRDGTTTMNPLQFLVGALRNSTRSFCKDSWD